MSYIRKRSFNCEIAERYKKSAFRLFCLLWLNSKSGVVSHKLYREALEERFGHKFSSGLFSSLLYLLYKDDLIVWDKGKPFDLTSKGLSSDTFKSLSFILKT